MKKADCGLVALPRPAVVAQLSHPQGQPAGFLRRQDRSYNLPAWARLLSPFRLGQDQDDREQHRLSWRRIVLSINRYGHVISVPARLSLQAAAAGDDFRGAASCPAGRRPWHLQSAVALPEQSPYPSEGTILAFNGRLRGNRSSTPTSTAPRRANLVYLAFEVKRPSKAPTPHADRRTTSSAANWAMSGSLADLATALHLRGRPTAISLRAARAEGFPVHFAFANAAFGFENGAQMRTTLTRSCGVR